MRHHNYYIYILTNLNRTVLYTGVTNDLTIRLTQHIEGIYKSSFTSKYKCHFLIYYEHFQYIDLAIAREKEIKGWSRKKKEDLIATENKYWRFLNEEVIEI
jgi:putative endonuclease